MNIEPGNNRKGSFRCLIVEDNTQAAEIMTIFFARSGIASETAENGQEGLRMILDNPLGYDAVFADLQMPVMSGFEMMKQIRESNIPSAKTIPIIAMSGTSGISVGDLTSGFDYFLKKPFEMRRLAEIIQEVWQLSKVD